MNIFTDEWAKPENSMGHVWALDKEGKPDGFAFDNDYHNGPVCTVCGYSFCVYEQTMASEACPGPDPRRPWREICQELAVLLETSMRLGAETDTPEGARWIQISDTLANRIAAELREWVG